MTDPTFASGLCAPHLRPFSRHGNALLYWSDRFDGVRQGFHLDLKSGESYQLTEAAALDGSSLTLSPDERSIVYFDGQTLKETVVATMRTRELHQTPENAVRSGMAQALDGAVFFAESRGGKSRLFRVNRLGVATAIAQVDGEIDLIMARPRNYQLAYRVAGSLWLINTDGTGKRPLRMEAGQNGYPLWTQSGRSVTYLHVPDDPKDLITLRENTLADNADRLIAKTSQFQCVSGNTDASVFVGASRSRASSYVLILLRVTRRELTLCEHRASDPAMVNPLFSPDSQSVFFSSDRHGKPALYRIRVEKFVEETNEG